MNRDAENMIMQARVLAGWITQADLDKTEEAEAPEGQLVSGFTPA